MPELPDVEVFKQYMDATSLHRKIEGVSTDKVSDMLTGASVSGLKKELKNRQFSETRRHGKYLFAAVADNGWLMLHFGMTGFLKYFKNPDQKPSHVRLQFDFANDFSLAIDSQRRLGKIGIIDDPDEFIRKEKLGPDVRNDLTFESFEKIINQGRGGLKSLLMNQKHLAGIGNIYSDEILFQTRLHPCIKVKEIKDNSPTIHRLYNAVTSVLDTAITVKANPDDMPDDFLIPNRKKDGHCPRCEQEIESEKCAGRTSYFCPECQPA